MPADRTQTATREARRPRPTDAAPKRDTQRSTRRSRRVLSLVALLILLGLAIAASLAFGSRPIDLARVWGLLGHPDASADSAVLHDLRIPRTVLGLTVGVALGLAGALMQSLTRNPLADPGVLGVNAGAGFAVVLAVALLGITGIMAYLWFAFVGAAIAAVGVYLLGGAGRQTATPVRLALAGVAIGAALTALTKTTILANQHAFNEFRFWVVGSLEGRGWNVFAATAPFIVVGVVLAFVLGPALNALALGEESGKALGVRVARTRALTMIAITLLCGAATAAAGPIAFVGLAVPFIARAIAGSDQRWVVLLSIVLGPVWLLIADVLARTVVAPSEVQVGIVAALSGAPFFIGLVRKRKVAAL